MVDTENDIFVWNELLAGDNRTYEDIYRKYIQTLFTYGRSLTDDEELIKDCVHDMFIHIYANRKNLGSTDNIRLYLLSSLKHFIWMALRRKNRHYRYLHSVGKEEWVENHTVIDQMIHVEEEAKREELINDVWALLTSRQREIVYYRYVEGLSLVEIANIQNIDYQSVANIIHRAVKKIKKKYLKGE